MPQKAIPLCPIFGQCGGCQYQDLLYSDELFAKQASLESLFKQHLPALEVSFDRIIASPREYGYRSRLDMKFIRTRDGRSLMGFSPTDRKFLLEVERCPIAMTAVSEFLPQLKQEAVAKWTPKYKNANLVVKTGDDGRVFWGGMGRRSLRLKPEDYLWTKIGGKKIFYSLESFFQANLSILPLLISKIQELNILNSETVFYDLYGGVGLFGVCFADRVKKVILVEDAVHSIELAKYNVEHHGLKNFDILPGRVDDVLLSLSDDHVVAMIDPPRAGLSAPVSEALAGTKDLRDILYLSCHPESLVRDLKIFIDKGWKVEKVMPFDFFPRTHHLETLVLLTNYEPRTTNHD